MHNILIILKHGCIIDYYTCVTDPVDAHATRMTIGTMARRRRGRRDDGAMMSASSRATFCRPPDDMEGREGRERRAACSRARGLEVMGDRARKQLHEGDGRRETEEAREAEELCRLEGSGSSEEGPSRQRKNPGQIVFVYLYR